MASSSADHYDEADQLAAKWLRWMEENSPQGGWPAAKLTDENQTDFKCYGSLWRRNPHQWDLYVERGHMTIFEIQDLLNTHPFVKAHTVTRFKFKGRAGRTS